MKRQVVSTNFDKIKNLQYIAHESAELSFADCGYEKYDVKNERVPRKRDTYTLVAIQNGAGIIAVNGKKYYVQENDLLLIFPKMEVWVECVSDEAWNYMWVGFRGVKAEECVMHMGFWQENIVHKTEHTGKMYELIEYMLNTQKDMTFVNGLRRNGMLELFFADLIEEYNQKAAYTELKYTYNSESSRYIKSAINYIAENYTRNIKISELADYIGVNRSYLTSSFKKLMGYSPKEYLIGLRMEKAKSLLETTDVPINTIANSVGYNDQLAFSKMFKRYAGISPMVYREEHRYQ